jgi:hypothetical protein
MYISKWISTNHRSLIFSAIDYIHNRTGLPIHITEFNVNTKFDTYPFDRTYQADILEVSLRQLFANPNVQAILMQHITPYPYGGDSDATCGPCIFVSGTYTPNVAGTRYLKLREEWSTRISGATVDANGNTAQVIKIAFLICVDLGDLEASKFSSLQFLEVSVGTALALCVTLVHYGGVQDLFCENSMFDVFAECNRSPSPRISTRG